MNIWLINLWKKTCFKWTYLKWDNSYGAPCSIWWRYCISNKSLLNQVSGLIVHAFNLVRGLRRGSQEQIFASKLVVQLLWPQKGNTERDLTYLYIYLSGREVGHLAKRFFYCLNLKIRWLGYMYEVNSGNRVKTPGHQ